MPNLGAHGTAQRAPEKSPAACAEPAFRHARRDLVTIAEVTLRNHNETPGFSAR